MTSRRKPSRFGRWLAGLSLTATEWAGGSLAFALAVAVILVFLIQRAQNKESKALQLKLNEIVAALQGASNRRRAKA